MTVSGARASSVWMMQGMTLLSSYIECCGAKFLLEALFTDWSNFPLTVSAIARSSIILYVRGLSGIVAMGLIFRLDGGFFLIVDHLTTLQQPSLTLSSASALHAFAASGVWAFGRSGVLHN